MFARRGLTAAMLLATIVMTGFVTTARADDATPFAGTWKWTTQGFGGEQETVLKLKQEGDKVTGTISGFQGNEDQIADGMVKDGELTFKVVRDFNGNQLVTKYTAKIVNGALKGKSELVIANDFEGKKS